MDMRVKVLLAATLLLVPRPASSAGIPGTWVSLDPPVGFQVSQAHDPVRQRMLVLLDSGRLWSQSIDGSGVSEEVGPVIPSVAQGAEIVFDPARDRLLLFGGLESASETWELSLSNPVAWNAIPTAPSPRPQKRIEHSAVYDPGQDRLLVIGGEFLNQYGFWQNTSDVWALSLSTSQWLSLGGLPSPHILGVAIVDPIQNRLVVHGGNTSSEVSALALDGSGTWTQIGWSQAPFRYGGIGVYDAARGRLVVFGGRMIEWPYQWLYDAWATRLSDGQWISLSTSGTPPSQQQHYPVGIYDPVEDRLLVYSRYLAGAHFMETRGLPFTTLAWEQTSTDLLYPAPRDGAGMTYDTAGERVVLFGGYGDGSWSNELWAYETTEENGWHLLDPGTGPSARSEHSMVLDPVRGRAFVYGGLNYATYYGDLWSLEMTPEGAVWQSIDAGPGPGPRASHTMVYDAPRDRILLFGGTGPSGRKNDLWALSLDGSPSWTLLTPSGALPSPRYDHAAVYDDIGDRMIVYGGQGAIELRDTWALALAGTPAWSSLPSTPVLLPGATAVIDHAGHRMVLVGSRVTASTSETEVWELALYRSSGWSKLTPAGIAAVLYKHAAVYDLGQDRMFFFDDASGLGALEWNRQVADVDRRGRVDFALDGIHPNPGTSGGTVAFTLPDAAPARLELIDVSGRRVLAREVGTLGPGHHRVALGAAHLDPGIYWVRLERAGVSLARKAVIVR